MTMKLTRRDMLKGTAAAGSMAALAPAALATPPTSAQSSTVLLRDDFSKMPSGWLTYPLANQGPAIQENQWMDSRARPFGNWFNGVADQDAWMVSVEAATDTHYMMMQLEKPAHDVRAVLMSGEDEWKDYDYEAKVRPLQYGGIAGIAFRYQTNLEYYVLGLTGGDTVSLEVQRIETHKFREPNWEVVKKAPFKYDTKQYHTLRVENRGNTIHCFVDGNKVFSVSDAIYPGGKVGMCAFIPARFTDVKCDAAAPVKSEIMSNIRSRNARISKLQSENPQPRLWKKFSVDGFGAANNVKFGDLNGDGIPEMLIGQNIQTVSRDAWDTISCLTAVDWNGKILWQSGKPGKPNGLLTNDCPFQIHDIDGDGKAEVVCIRDFQLQILNGQTGKVKKWVWTPIQPPLPEKHGPNVMRPYELVLGDSLFFCNVSGDKNRTDILIKDRYTNFWIFNKNLELLWKGEGQTGHCPYMFDVNGYDRIQIGYSMWDHTGKQLWSHDKDLKDHADSISVVNMTDDPSAPPQVYATGSDEGYLRFSYDGKLLTHQMIGHAQASSIAKYRMDLPGLQLMMVNFHWNPGIMFQYDAQGNMLKHCEPIHNGSKMCPVNWRGDGQEFVLLSPDPKFGGMVDGNFDRCVMFPNDGHPDLTQFALDLTGDGRDEVVVWDEKSVWVYTQDRPFRGEKIYAPVRNPLYNFSNYSALVSLPAWKNAPRPAPAAPAKKK